MRENDPDDRQLSGGRADHYRPTTADRGVLRDFPDQEPLVSETGLLDRVTRRPAKRIRRRQGDGRLASKADARQSASREVEK